MSQALGHDLHDEADPITLISEEPARAVSRVAATPLPAAPCTGSKDRGSLRTASLREGVRDAKIANRSAYTNDVAAEAVLADTETSCAPSNPPSASREGTLGSSTDSSWTDKKRIARCTKPEDSTAYDPRISALQETLMQHQCELNKAFVSMVSSLQSLHLEQQQKLETVLAKTFAADADVEPDAGPGDDAVRVFDRGATPNTTETEQSDCRKMESVGVFDFQNTHEHAILKRGVTPPCLVAAYPEKEDELMPDASTPVQECAQAIAHSVSFRVSVTVVIALSSLLLGWQSQVGLDLAKAGEDPNAPGSKQSLFAVIEVLIGVFFTGELTMRILAEGPHCFVHGRDRYMNIFDSLLVVFAITHLTILFVQHVHILQVGRIIQLVRLVRLTRLLRVLRVIRLLPKTFKLMVSSIIASCAHLMWVFLLLLLIMYSFSVLFMNGVTEYFEHNLGKDPALDAVLLDRYGTVLDGVLTLFACTSGGNDWENVLEPVWEMGVMYGILFVLFIYFTIFGALNVLTSLFVDSVYKLSLRSRQISVQNEKDMSAIQINRIRGFFEEADVTNAGFLSLDQFVASLQNAECAAYFNSLGLDVSQAPELFDLLDEDNNNKLCVDEFVRGCMKLRGQARSLDVNMLLTEQRKMMHNWAKFMTFLEVELEALKRQVKKCQAGSSSSYAGTPLPTPKLIDRI